MRDLHRPVRRVQARADIVRSTQWPHSVPAVQQLLAAGLDLTASTVLVGENATGKSTMIEALAEAYGFNPEGGSTGAMHTTRRSESSLGAQLQLVRGAAAARGGYFLRAETMHGFYTYLEGLEEVGMPSFHERSHGESFLDLIESRCFGPSGPRPGLYLFDEVESALSFSSSLRVLALLVELLDEPGAQVVVATHSPVLSALPGARILQLDAQGFAEAEWNDLELVANERHFLSDPRRFLRHL